MTSTFPTSQKISDLNKRKADALAERSRLQDEEEKLFQRFSGKPAPKNTNGEVKEPEGDDW